VSIPKVLVGRGSLGKNHFKLIPNGITALFPIRTVFKFRTYPNNFVVPNLSASSRNFAVPLIVFPGINFRKPVGTTLQNRKNRIRQELFISL